MQVLQQLRFLLYRNFLLKRRNKKQTIYEVVSVLYLVGILAVIKLTSVKPTTKPAVHDAQIPTFNLRSPYFVVWPPKEIGYVYAEKANRSVVEPIVNRLSQTLPSVRFTSFRNVDELEDGHKRSPRNLSLGMVFETTKSKGSTQIEYTIKAPYDAVVDPDKKFVGNEEDKCRTPTPQYFMFQYNKLECPVHSYYASGFSILQAYIEAAAIEVVSGQSGYLPANVSIQMAPKDKFLTPLSYLKTLVSIYMVIAFSPYVMFLLTFIVSEKEKKIKEAMKIMGLNMYVFWLGWFITYAVVISIGVLLVTIIAYATKLFGNSDFLIILIILLLYALSIETLAFMLTPLFTKAKTAGTAGSMVTIIFSPLSLLHVYLNTSNSVKWLTCLLSPVALSLSLTPALEHGDGLSWKNLGNKGDFPAAYAMLMLIIDIILYLIIAIYLDAVFPGEYGIRKHPLFFLNPSFWKTFSKAHKARTTSLMRSTSVKSEEPYADVEDVPSEFQDKKVISIRKIAKIFKPQGKDAVRAVDGISLDVYEGQITALLGHNGAGKSTLIALLTGLLPISSGKAIIYGFNIVTSEGLDKLREILGLCPQQNIIFDELTPQEHLKIYAGIKGVDPKNIQAMVDETLQDVDLLDQKDTISKSLSGGQKRKLCVGVALIGDPKVVFLDEPTSGMDPASRRKIWSLLQRKREGRVIFLTTHFMDEADILADYKAIISKGKLRCAGSSLFLKNRFGVGYHLRMVIDPTCERNKIVDLVTENVPGAKLSREHSKELAFQLPLTSVDKFTDLFASLENHNSTGEPCSAAGLGIRSYGVSMTTLEEVFLKLDDLEDDLDTTAANQGEGSDHDRGTTLASLTASEPCKREKRMTEHLYNESADLQAPEMVLRRKHIYSFAWQQFWALMEIRFWMTIRNKVKIFFQVVIPPIFIIVGMVLLNKQRPQQASSSKVLHMKPSLYLAKPGGKSLPNFLVKNSTSGDVEGFLSGIISEGIAYDVVKNLSNLLDMQPHNLAVDVDTLPPKEIVKYLLRYNDSAIHSIPVGINFVSNTLLRRALSTSGKSYSGEGEPLSLTSVSFKPVKPPWVYDYSSYVSVLLISMCFCLMPSGFAIQVVHYREVGVRHQLRVSGAGRLVYWMHFLIGDMTLYLFPVVLVYILIAAFDINGLNSSPAMGTLGFLLILYIPTSLLFAYILSFPFNKWETVQNVFGTLFIFLGIIPYTTVSTIDMVSGDIKGSTAAHALHIIFLLLDPPYAIFGGLYYITRVFRVQSILSQSNDVHIPSSKYFELELENGIPATLIVLTIQLIFFSWLVYCLDCWKTGGVAVFPFSHCSRKRRHWNNRQCGSVEAAAEELNEDVQLERERACKTYLDNKAGEKSVLVQGLSKSFGKKTVVKDLSFCVDRGEIMGLLGPNGAGKTTTLNMVTADFQPTTGMIYVGGYNTNSDLDTAFQSLGYCPQFGGLFELCTVKEHLRCYALLKGISRDNVDSTINHFMSALKITEHANKKEKELSGGTKRKLSFLISMMGNPNTVMLDEPSTGMDPAARRFLWTAISRNIGEDRGAILTTHSMEEADALCSRVGIIVKGSLRCIGTTQELKTNYGGGYQLEVKGKKGANEDIEEAVKGTKRFVEGIFPSAVLAESFGTRMTFKVPKDGVQNLSTVFRKLEEGKSSIDIEEYSFSQSSLEQVFLEFAKEQDDDLTGANEMKSPVESRAARTSMA